MRGDGVRRVGQFQTKLASPRGLALMWTPKIKGKVLVAA